MQEQIRHDLSKYVLAVVSPLLTQDSECTYSADAMGTLYTLKITKDDFGRVIGKNGQTINSIKHLLRAAGLSQGIRASLVVPEAV